MRRRDFITLLSGAAAARPLSSLAQQPQKVPRIAFLTIASPPGSQYTQAFIQGLADLGRECAALGSYKASFEWVWDGVVFL
jgi:hypothetical protein